MKKKIAQFLDKALLPLVFLVGIYFLCTSLFFAGGWEFVYKGFFFFLWSLFPLMILGLLVAWIEKDK